MFSSRLTQCKISHRWITARLSAGLWSAHILIPFERSIHLVLRHEECLVEDVPFHLKFWAKLTHPFQNGDFQSIIVRSASAKIPSRKITNMKSTTGFQWAQDEQRTLLLTCTLQRDLSAIAELLVVLLCLNVQVLLGFGLAGIAGVLCDARWRHVVERNGARDKRLVSQERLHSIHARQVEDNRTRGEST